LAVYFIIIITIIIIVFIRQRQYINKALQVQDVTGATVSTLGLVENLQRPPKHGLRTI